MSEYLETRRSAALLKTIIEKRLPRLVQHDREKLLDVLMANTTRCFPAMTNTLTDLTEAAVPTPNEVA